MSDGTSITLTDDEIEDLQGIFAANDYLISRRAILLGAVRRPDLPAIAKQGLSSLLPDGRIAAVASRLCREVGLSECLTRRAENRLQKSLIGSLRAEISSLRPSDVRTEVLERWWAAHQASESSLHGSANPMMDEAGGAANGSVCASAGGLA